MRPSLPPLPPLLASDLRALDTVAEHRDERGDSAHADLEALARCWDQLAVRTKMLWPHLLDVTPRERGAALVPACASDGRGILSWARISRIARVRRADAPSASDGHSALRICASI
jgi:hypothetical protein